MENTTQRGAKTRAAVAALKREGGATIGELSSLTGWLPHTVRGWISGTARKRLGLRVVRVSRESGETAYAVQR